MKGFSGIDSKHVKVEMKISNFILKDDGVRRQGRLQARDQGRRGHLHAVAPDQGHEFNLLIALN